MRKTLALIASIFLLMLSWVPAHAQEELYFTETGHYVKNDFLLFYRNNPNALLLYGYPITEQITGKDGRTVQYFQRARFELSAGQAVTLTPLGRETYIPRESLDVKSAFACRTYSETGFSVCFSFLEFFEKYGGVTQFGYPISGFEYHENKLVQYFENTRLEWHPWKPEGQRVVVSDLGRVYFDGQKEDPALLAPVSNGDRVQIPTRLQVRAFPWKAVTLASDNQIFYIILQDQNAQPVVDANCTAVVHWPNGANNFTIVKTNTNGVAIFSLSFNNQPYGSLIYTDITCTYNALSATTTTSFRIWY
jgi:hypothetical protein